MVEIDNVLVNDNIFNKKFTCDLDKCKGACCTLESELGAPVTEDEVSIINDILDTVKSYLPKEHIEKIESEGFWEYKENQLLLKSVNNRACVFVYYDGDIAKCGIEKAYREGKVDFIKPISCHLFPIRITDFGGPIVRYEKYPECKPARKLGEKTKLSVAEFCSEALKRLFGNQWVAKLKKYDGVK